AGPVAGPDTAAADGEARDVVARVNGRGDAVPCRIEMLQRAGLGGDPEPGRPGDHARLAERIAGDPPLRLPDDVEARIDRDQVGIAVGSPADDPDCVLRYSNAERDTANRNRTN